MKQKKKQPKQGIGRLLELAGEKKQKLIAAVFLSVLSSAARIVPYFTIYYVILELLSHYTALEQINRTYIYTCSFATFAAVLLYGICSFLSSSLAHTAAYDIIYTLRLTLMEKLSRIPSGFFTRTTQGALKKILSDDTEQLEVFLAHHICDIAAAVAMPSFTMLYLFCMDWRLALVTLIPLLIALYLLSTCLRQPDKAALQAELADAQETMQGTIIEYIHGMQVVKVFNRTLQAFRRYEHDLSHFVHVVSKTAYANAKPMGAYYAFFGAQLLFLLPASILLLSKAESYVDFLPVVLLFFLVGSGLKEPLEDMMIKVVETSRVTEGMNRIDHILNQPEISETGTGNPTSCDITFERVSFSYTKGTQALNNISFTLPSNSLTGLVGPSGGGKSTLAQLLLRFYEPQQGRICIGGVDIREIAPEKLTSLISYVFQDSFLFHDTVENNIRMGNQTADHADVEQAAKNAGIHDVIVKLPQGYDTVIGDQNAYLSGGEKQRLAIARVFLKNTPIVILDEATAYADAENERKIQEAFARLSRGKTVLMIAHRLKTVEHADQLVVLNNGVLAGTGTHESLLRDCDLYAQMIQADKRRERWTIQREPKGGTAK